MTFGNGRLRPRAGTWHQRVRHGGPAWFDLEPLAEPSRWLTLYALRVLRWWDAGLRARGR